MYPFRRADILDNASHNTSAHSSAASSSSQNMPAIFVSHGSPDTAIADTAAARFLRGAASNIGQPAAIVVVTAHFELDDLVGVTADAAPDMIYDFGGFSPELSKIVYPAPGHPQLAAELVDALRAAGLHAEEVTNRGFDHGTWVPLHLMFPQADVPVVQISVDPQRDAAHHFALGQLLSGLGRRNILVIGSGSFTHNLGEAFAAFKRGDRVSQAPDWVIEFSDWMRARLREGDLEALLAYRTNAPYAVRNHPTDEHLMPLYVALGAAQGHSGQVPSVDVLHSSNEFGVLAMDAFAFRT